MDIRLSISEASKLFGVSQRTLRRAIAKELINYTLVQGRYKISFESLLAWSQSSPLTQQKRDTDGIGQYVGQWKTAPVVTTPTEPVAAPAAPGVPKAIPRAKKVAPVPVMPMPTTSVVPTPPAPSVTPDEPTLSWD